MKIIESGTTWIIEDTLNDKLLNQIKDFLEKNLNFLYEKKDGYSTIGTNANQYWIKTDYRMEKKFSYSNNQYEDFKKEYKKEIYNRLIASNILKDNADLVDLTAWSVIGEENSYHMVHNHGTSNRGISTVLYLNVPNILNSSKIDNNIFLILHTNPSNEFINQHSPSIVHVKPKIGSLLIFPNYIPHGTYPQTKGVRQTFNMEFLIRPKISNVNNKVNYN